MQIKLNNVTYGKIKNASFQIDNNKILGIVSNDIYLLKDINEVIKNNSIANGNIKYSPRYSKTKIGLISSYYLNDLPSGIVNDYINIKKVSLEQLKLFNIDKKIFDRKVDTLSKTEKIKLMFLNCMINDVDTILIDGILEILDSNMRKKIINLLINLKKFNNKTIVISCIDIDIIYEFVDNLVLIINNECITSNNKYDLFENISESSLCVPFVKKVEKNLSKKNKINLGNNDNINELIKSIYREMR